MKKSILILFFLFINIVSAQVNIETIIQEDFKDNSNSWKLFNNKNYSCEIKDNQLYFNNRSEKNKWAYLNTKINLKKDFVIETSLKLVSGTNNNLLSLIFNKTDDAKNYNDFGISDNGYWKFKQKNNSSIIGDTNWYKIDYINAGEYNTLTIQKINEKVFFLINNTPILVKTNMDLSFNQVGLSVCSKSEVAFKYLKIGYLKMSKNDKEKYANQLYQKLIDAKTTGKNVLIEDTITKELHTSFDKNEFGFYLNETKDYTYKIVDSALEINNTSKSYYHTWSKIKINPMQDFDISTSLKRVSGTINKGISLVIKDKINKLQLAYAQNGYWFSDVQKNDKSTKFSKWQKTNLVKERENNSLRIKKIQNTVYFILNNKVVNKVVEKGFGNTIYIKAPDSIKIRVDDLKLTQTYRSKKEQDKLIAQYDNLWDKAKTENVGALGKTEKQQIVHDKAKEKFKKKQDKARKKYNKMFKNAPLSDVIKKLGQPYKSNSFSISYRYNDSYDGRPQDLEFFYIPYQKGKIKYKMVNYAVINYKN
ncbi:hypothetical protein [Lutibacter sp. Hel_I_33_5]|uniref:hypothetical protein n=1 Tax=Lutibacter sp. Hel_I_33_5 TaxID=1566289 RepID=UPI0011A55AF4|nr:hypothetical protein [Lutibacter sp. Hel_I_33_5]